MNRITKNLSPLTVITALGLSIAIGSTAKAQDGLPDPGFDITKGNTALLVTDPQNDFLHPDGVAWGVIASHVADTETVVAAMRNAD